MWKESHMDQTNTCYTQTLSEYKWRTFLVGGENILLFRGVTVIGRIQYDLHIEYTSYFVRVKKQKLYYMSCIKIKSFFSEIYILSCPN